MTSNCFQWSEQVPKAQNGTTHTSSKLLMMFGTGCSSPRRQLSSKTPSLHQLDDQLVKANNTWKHLTNISYKFVWGSFGNQITAENVCRVVNLTSLNGHSFSLQTIHIAVRIYPMHNHFTTCFHLSLTWATHGNSALCHFALISHLVEALHPSTISMKWDLGMAVLWLTRAH